ncbi:hypothetical protein [Chromobacterium phragmitis]|nr:hypothetical protein [Chromobacterium phragmitis]
MNILRNLNKSSLRKKAVVIALGGVLIMTPVAAYADWGDILGKILNA